MPVEDVKKLMARVSALEQEKNDAISRLIDEKEDLQHELDKIDMVKEYQGHMNQNQKIKYVLKIKEENNSLKKQLTKLCNEMRKLTDAAPSDQSKDMKTLNHKLKRYKEELEKRTADAKKQLKSTGKICDYILSRAVYPDSFRDQTRDAPKVKAAIEGVTFMARQIQKKDKELQALRKESEDQKVLLLSSKRESATLRKTMEVSGFDKRPLSETN